MGLQWILGVADYFAQWPGAAKPIITPTPWTGLAVTAAGLLLALWQGPYGRGAGMLCCGLAAAGWLVAERPDILISRDARLVGVMTDNGRAISKARGDQFTADIWAENDGQPVARDAAAIYRDGVGNLNIIWAEDTEPKYTWVLKNSRRAISDG